MVSGDRLARIEAAAKDDRWTNLTYVPPADVLVLVEIAEAAREVTLLIFESDEDEVRAAERFRSALSRLDGGATEEQT